MYDFTVHARIITLTHQKTQSAPDWLIQTLTFPCQALIVSKEACCMSSVPITHAVSRPLLAKGSHAMPNIFQLLANEEKLTDELFAFITDHNADSRNGRAIISVLHEVAPYMVDVAECMIIDGVEERHYVEEYVHAVLSGEGRELE
jgi:hypothetical protein